MTEHQLKVSWSAAVTERQLEASWSAAVTERQLEGSWSADQQLAQKAMQVPTTTLAFLQSAYAPSQDSMSRPSRIRSTDLWDASLLS